MKLFVKAVSLFSLGAALVGALIFLPAGTLAYPKGWLFMALLFVPMFCAGLVMLAKSPALLEKRLQAKEKQGEQKAVIRGSGLMFLTGFVVSGLDFRFGWSHFPLWLTVAACVVFLAAYGIYAEVLRENAYLSRTIEVQEGQKVIDTGLYGIVRHPMYFATVLLFWAMPLVLGSWFSFLVFLIYPMLLVKRIRNEEEVLKEGLAGYADYLKKVRWRLIPYVW